MEQVIRPTGLLDPRVEVRPVEGQIDDLLGEINQRAEKGERVLVTTLTKKVAEDLTAYLRNAGVKVMTRPSAFRAARPMVWIREVSLRRKPSLSASRMATRDTSGEEAAKTVRLKNNMSKKELEAAIAKMEKEMKEASKRLEFEYAAVLRDRIIELRGK